MTTNIWKVVAAIFVLILLLAGVKALQIVKMVRTKPPMPVETVTSAVVQVADWAPVFSSVGNISPIQGTTVSTELGGIVSEIHF